VLYITYKQLYKNGFEEVTDAASLTRSKGSKARLTSSRVPPGSRSLLLFRHAVFTNATPITLCGTVDLSKVSRRQVEASSAVGVCQIKCASVYSLCVCVCVCVPFRPPRWGPLGTTGWMHFDTQTLSAVSYSGISLGADPSTARSYNN